MFILYTNDVIGISILPLLFQESSKVVFSKNFWELKFKKINNHFFCFRYEKKISKNLFT